MKLFSLVFLATLMSCNSNVLSESLPLPCKVVAEIGGCDETYCGVRFTDGTHSDRVVRPAVGATMCKTINVYRMQEK